MALTSLLKIAAREALKKGGSKALSKALPRNIEVPKKTEGLKSLDEPVDISKKLKTGDKEKVIDEIGEAEEISKASIKEISPKKTTKAYKLFRRNPETGELFPLFVKMGDNNPIPMNKWIQAEEGLRSSTGKVKSSLGNLAYRPGFHAGDIPIAKHIGDKWNLKTLTKDKTIKKPNIRPENQIWAEVEFANDVDWQTEAIKRAIPLKSGKGIQAKTAHITDQVPTGGNYRYKTNPNMEGEWIIGGEMKVNRVLSDKEVKAINKKAGTSDLPRLSEVVSKRKGGLISLNEGGGIDDYGISADDMQEAYAEAGVDIFGPDLTEEDFNYTDADILAGQRAKDSTRPDDTVPGDLGPEEAQILSRDRSFFTKSPQEVLAMTSMTPQQIRDKQGGDFGESTPMLTFDTIVYEGLPTDEGPDWTEEGGIRTDYYNRRMKSKEKNLMDTLKYLGKREQQQLDTLYKGWRNLDPKDYPPEVIDYINQLKQDRPDRFDPTSDFAYTKEGQARAKNRLDNIQDNRVKAMELLSDSTTTKGSIYRKGGGKIMAGGLSGMNREMMIGGQPYRLSYIDPRQAKVGGPVIRRVSGGDIMGDDFIGGYTDEMAGVDTGTTNLTEEDFDYTDADILGGTSVRDNQVGLVTGDTFTPVTGGFGEGEDPGSMGERAFDPTPGYFRQLDFLEKKAQGTSTGDFLNIPKTGDRIRVSEKDDIARYGKEGYNLSKDMANLQNRYALNLAEFNKEIQNKEAEEIEKQGFVSSKREGEIKKDSAVEAAKKTFDNFREFKGIDYPAYMPGGTAVALGNFIAKMAGVIGTAEVRGIPVHVKEDGNISIISPENEPGFDQSKMDLGNEPAPSRRRLPVSTAAATSQDEAETPKTGMAGLLARRSAPASRSESNVFLSRLLDNIYGTDRSKMLG